MPLSRKVFKMKKLFLYSIVLFGCTLMSCGDDEVPVGTTSEVTLNFTANYGTNMLDSDTQTTHDFEEESTVRFTEFRFFISDVVFTTEEGTDETALIEIDEIDFSRSNMDAKYIRSVPTGKYSGIKFFIGVEAEFNNTKPEEYASEHPLANTASYWLAWNSYIHCKLEGFLDNGTANEIPFSYHTGSDDLLRSVTIPYNITLAADGSFDLDIMVDVEKILYKNDTYWNIEEFPATHNPSNPDDLNTANYIMDNLSEAFKIQ